MTSSQSESCQEQQYHQVAVTDQALEYQGLVAKFQKACSQIILLNNQIVHIQTRYERAVAGNHRSFRYTLRLRLMSVEGVRNCLYEYARQTGDEIERMQQGLIQAGLMEVEYDVIEEEEEEGMDAN